MLAPYWTDLDGTGAEGIRAGTLTDGVNTWIVARSGTSTSSAPTSARAMQVWIGINGVEDISYGYDVGHARLRHTGRYGLTVGAENPSGTGGADIGVAAAGSPPTSSYRITTTPGAPGETFSYTLTILGVDRGNRSLTTSMTADTVVGTTTVTTAIVVTRR